MVLRTNLCPQFLNLKILNFGISNANIRKDSIIFPIICRLTDLLLLSSSLGKRRYNVKLWKTFTDCFNCLPVAAIVDEKIFCCHGGLSPDLQSMEQIRRIMRPTDVPDQGLLCDLLWSDPDKDVMGW